MCFAFLILIVSPSGNLVAEDRSDDSREDRVRSEFFPDIFPGALTIPENLGKQSATDGLAAMDGNHGAPPVGMTEEVVTSLDSYQVKTKAA